VGVIRILDFEIVDRARIRDAPDVLQRNEEIFRRFAPLGMFGSSIDARVKPLARILDDVDLALGNRAALYLLGRSRRVFEKRGQQSKVQAQLEQSEREALGNREANGARLCAMSIAHQITLDECAHHRRRRIQNRRWNLLVMSSTPAERLEQSGGRNLADLDGHRGSAPDDEWSGLERLGEQPCRALDEILLVQAEAEREMRGVGPIPVARNRALRTTETEQTREI